MSDDELDCLLGAVADALQPVKARRGRRRGVKRTLSKRTNLATAFELPWRFFGSEVTIGDDRGGDLVANSVRFKRLDRKSLSALSTVSTAPEERSTMLSRKISNVYGDTDYAGERSR
ncbi:hypothetical protein [Bradyrhizobium retamae]|uniref:hypothetical protein n=1 Tax=Bradyrhizobium retamae TaxID=1300035 RepID=UPI000A76DCFA|nr:hypothetical protein [Bradyrhizobium retamae]